MAESSLNKFIQLYNIQSMNKYQNYKITKKPLNSITSLNTKLFSKLDLHDQPNRERSKTNGLLYSQFQQQFPVQNTILQKAKQLTYSNKGKIQRIKKQMKKIEERQTAGEFLTGVGLYEDDKQEEPIQSYGQFDEDSLMRNLREDSYDDLAQLRRMIRKTENNLRQYSQSVYNVQSSIMNAADKYGKQLGVGLFMKINRCGLDRTFSKFKPSTKVSPATEMIKGRTFSSHANKRPKF